MKSLDMPHQMWLQSLIASRFMSETHAKALHKEAVTSCSMTYKASDYDHFFSKVAKAIGLVGLEIRRCVDETKGTKIVGLVNTKGDEIAQLATTLSAHEITFVKVLIRKIVKAPHEAFCVGSRDALDFAHKLEPSIPASKAEVLLDKLVSLGWFHLSRAGRYSMTPRTLMELQKYLQNTYEDRILSCTACEEILTSGSACGTEECNVRVHRHCLFKWESSLKNVESGFKACSHCRKAWDPVPVGESVLASQHSHVRQARGGRRADRDSDEEEQMEEEEDDLEDVEEEEEGHDDDNDEEEEEEAVVEEEEVEHPRGSNRRRRSAVEDTEPSRRTRHKVEESDELDISSEVGVPPSRRRSSRR